MLSTETIYFMEVARLGSMGQAAQTTGVTQPALSKAIARLERQCGTALMTRTPKGVELTDAGRALFEKTALAQAVLDDGLQAARDIGGGHAGLLRMGMTPATSPFVLAALFPRLRNERPAAVLKITTAFGDELFASLEKQEITFAVGPLPLKVPDSIQCEVLYEEGFSIVFHQSHPLALKDPIELSDLDALEVAAPSPNEAARQMAEETLRTLGLRAPRVMVEANTLETLLFATAHSNLVTLIPSQTPATQLPPGLIMRPLPQDIIKRRIALFRGPGYASSVAERAMQLLRDHSHQTLP